MRTMVTGGAGFIGSTLVDRLLAEGHEVDVVDDLSTGSLANLAEARAVAGGALTIHQLDIRLPDMVELIARRRPEVVFHLAAQADVRVSVERPVFDAEVNRARHPPRARGRPARRDRSGWSSRPAAAPSTARSTRPSSPCASRTPTGRSPPTGCPRRRSSTTSSPTASCTRWSSAPWPWPTSTGPARTPTARPGWSPSSPGAWWTGTPVTIFGDGEQTRDFVYVDDVVDAFVRAAARGGGLVCNVGTGQETSVNDLYATMAAAAGVDAAAQSRTGPGRRAPAQLPRHRAGGHPARLAPVDRARRRLGGRARVHSATGRPERGPRLSGRGPRPDRRTTSAATEPSRSQPAGTPRTTAAGTPRSLPMTSSAAAASSSATQTSVATSSRPPASSVPRRSSDRGDAGAADGHVGDPLAPGPPEGVRHDHRHLDPEAAGAASARSRRAERSGSTGRRAAVPSGTLERSTPALAQTKPCDVSEMTRSPRRRSTRTDSLVHEPGLGLGVAGVDGDDPALGLGHDLLGDHHHVAVEQPRPTAVAGRPGRPDEQAARSSPGRTSATPDDRAGPRARPAQRAAAPSTDLAQGGGGAPGSTSRWAPPRSGRLRPPRLGPGRRRPRRSPGSRPTGRRGGPPRARSTRGRAR